MEGTEGQVMDSAEPVGTTAGTTGSDSKGQPNTPDQKTASGTESVGESFFDPESIRGKPELESAYKEMQRAFTKRTQELSKGRDKIRQYDEFLKNPIESMKQVAQSMGYQLVQGTPEQKGGKGKTFETWDEVFSAAKEQVLEELKPVIGEVQNLKKQNIESYLDNNFSDWRTYEDEMMANLQRHPSLVSSPDDLYRLSVPQEVYEARLMKKLTAKLNGTKAGSTIQGQSTTSRQVSDTPKGPLSFEQAVEVAKNRLAQRGLSAPRES